MKKIIFAFLIGLVMVGCASSKKAAKVQQQPEQQKLDAQKPIIWKQELYPKLAVGDKIFFLNSSEIVLEGDLFSKSFFLDGAINRLDSILEVIKTVPELTQGVVTSLKRGSNGQITDMVVSFSKNDATYQFDFKLRSDGAYTLNGNAKLLFNGKEYKVQATIKGGDCLLMVVYNKKEIKQTINEKAEGQTLPNKNDY